MLLADEAFKSFLIQMLIRVSLAVVVSANSLLAVFAGEPSVYGQRVVLILNEAFANDRPFPLGTQGTGEYLLC